MEQVACRHLYLIRHGLVEARYQGRYIGATDAALAPEGEQQMAALRRHHQNAWDQVRALLVSPLARCGASADALFGADGPPCQLVAALREIDFGAWEGWTADEIARRDGAAWQRWLTAPQEFTFPGGESVAGFGARIADFCRTTLPGLPQTSAIIAHAGVIRRMVLHVTGIAPAHLFSFDCDLSSLTVVRLYAGDRGVVQSLNNTSHLQPSGEQKGGV